MTKTPGWSAIENLRAETANSSLYRRPEELALFKGSR